MNNPLRTLTYQDRLAISHVGVEIALAATSVMFATRADYVKGASESLGTVRRYIAAALKKLDAAEALLDPATKTEAVPLRSAEELASIQAQAHAALDAAATAEAVADGGGI